MARKRITLAYIKSYETHPEDLLPVITKLANMAGYLFDRARDREAIWYRRDFQSLHYRHDYACELYYGLDNFALNHQNDFYNALC